MLTAAIFLLVYFNFPVWTQPESAKLGITFSNRYASDIHLDWKKTFIEILDDLNVKKIRIPIYWDLVEAKEGEYDFSAVDWQLDEARKRDAEIILVVGQKVPRWPECAIPEWAKKDDQIRKARLLKFIDVAVKRYKDNHPEIKYWQVENEPFLPFGICPPSDANLLDSEIALVRFLDPTRKIIITDSGELSLWIQAAKRADIFGTTMYRTIWKKGVGYFNYPIGPRFFQFKRWLIKLFAHQDNAFVVELQAEPWINGWTTEQPLDEQFKSMNPEKLQENVAFAEKTGLPEIYLWGAEWWYWLKANQNHPELWETAKKMFAESNGPGVISYPRVDNFYPKNNARDVALDIEDPIVVDFTRSTKTFFVKFELNPPTEIIYQNNPEKTQFKLLPKILLKGGQKYEMKISVKRAEKADSGYKEIYASNFQTLPPKPTEWDKNFSARVEQAKIYTRPQISEGKYIDINLTAQILSIFENGKLLDSFLTSTGKRGMETPKGTYAISNKTPRAWSKIYGLFMPDWMALVPSGKFGIHELPEWPGGYKEGANHLGTPVSHGCVRLGVGPAKRVYEWAEIGTPVVVY